MNFLDLMLPKMHLLHSIFLKLELRLHPFLTHLLQCVVSCVENTSGSSKTLYAKATLTSGTGGVWVQIRNYSGDSVIKKKLFPYQDTSVGPVSNTVSAGDRRKLYVKPNTTGQTVTGNLDYYFQ